MRIFNVFICAVIASLSFSLPVAAGTFIDVSASSIDEGAVRGVWDNEVRILGVWADQEFQISVSESNPNGIDTCWIYLDGTTTTGTTRDFTLEDYRIHYGCVVILYDNDTYEDYEFHIQALWSNPPTPGATAPASPSLPADQTAADLIDAVAEFDPDGPNDRQKWCTCSNEMCYDYFCNAWECSTNKNVNPEDCPNGDIDCVDVY